MRLPSVLVTSVILHTTLAPPASGQDVTRYVRFAVGDDVSYGILENQTVRQMAGDDLFALGRTDRTYSLADVQLLAPVDPDRVQKVLGVAINTRRPSRMEPIPHPRFFAKFPTSLGGPDDPVELPPEAGNLNYEGELVLVIGREGRHIPEERALEYVFGVTAGNDFSENTWYGERNGVDEPTRLISKGTDSWGPIGPAIVTGLDYTDLAVETRLNGEVVQRGRTSDLVNGVANLVSYVSRYVTLKPGDLIFTGTVARVEGARVVMRPGDVLEVEIEGIGVLRNRIVEMGSGTRDRGPGTRNDSGTRDQGPETSNGALGSMHRPPGRSLPDDDVASFVGSDGPAPTALVPGPRSLVRDRSLVPDFTPDPFWPKTLPNDWILGQVSGVAVDADDHVWIVHRPLTLTAREAGAAQDPPLAECCLPAPSVIEFDQGGNVESAWGGPDSLERDPEGNVTRAWRGGDRWPTSEHGLYVDHDGNVWMGSNGANDQVVLKFDREGRRLLTIGEWGVTGGSADTLRLGSPADVTVDPTAGEVYVADGYRNRRIIVFDATTGAYRRHWGAYGEPPNDGPLGPYDPDAAPARSFRSPMHAVRVSRDGFVYAADRVNNRIQVFQKDGTFVREAFLAPRTLAMGSVWDLEFSPDEAQTYVYVPDGTNMKVWILERDRLEVVGSFGRGGRNAGHFEWVHNLAADSRGNVYTTEVNTGKRVQRFVREERE